MLTVADFYSNRPFTPDKEAAFFKTLRLANGSAKTTADSRMDDLNALIASCWRDKTFRPTEILDVGVSSGITTAEWLDQLSAAGFKVRIIGVDLALRANIVPLWPGAYAIERDGHVLGHIIFGVPIRTWRRRRDYATGYAVISALASKIATRHSRRTRAPQSLLLISPRALRHEGIEWVEDDVLAPNPERFIRRFDAIRAANLLICGRFDTNQLQRAVANLKERLTGPGARLIVNRTLKHGSNHATMFRLTDTNCFEAEARLGEGSEIEDIVLRA